MTQRQQRNQKPNQMKNTNFNYIAKNKITGLYFDGESFKADQFHAKHITDHKAWFKLIWNYNDNLEIIDVTE
jgi:hypothetical protein